MTIVDCFWELNNLGKKTVEITIGTETDFDPQMFSDIIKDYEYAVVKVPMNMPIFNLGLSRMGFVCIETQMNVATEKKDFDFSRVAHLYNDTSYEVVKDNDNLYSVISQIQPGMFSTDRITIDPLFGENVGCQRYINWIKTEFLHKKSQLVKVIHQDEHVGFMLLRFTRDSVDLLLNGLYKFYQGKGMGLLTPASPMMYVKKNNIQIKKETTSISSNNIPVVKLYNKLNFQIINQTYVFVKHL